MGINKQYILYILYNNNNIYMLCKSFAFLYGEMLMFIMGLIGFEGSKKINCPHPSYSAVYMQCRVYAGTYVSYLSLAEIIVSISYK